MNQPLISVIIPAYNAEKTIKRTIESVLNQTFSDFEIIIVNDGSQDSTVEIASSFSDSRIKVFSYPNAGAAVGRNRGFSHAVGEFIAFLDADDLWTSDKLEAQLKALQNNSKAGVAYSWADIIDECDRFICLGSHITANGNVYAQLLLVCFVVSGSNPLIRRQAFVDVGGFDESLPASQDYDLYLRLAARYDYVAVPSPQVLYRLSTTGMSTNIRRQEETSLLVRKQAFKVSPTVIPKSLKHHSIANFYKHAVCKVLNEVPSRKRGLESARLVWHLLLYDPALLHKKVTLKILYRVILFVLFSPQTAQNWLNKFQRFSNINQLLSTIIVEPSQLK